MNDRSIRLLMGTVTVVAGLLCATAHADVVVLNDGQRVQGAILKSTTQAVWVDLGYTVLEIPRDRIASIEETADTSSATAATPVDIFFSATNLPERSPQEHAKRIGDAIIKVATPAGLGSGFIINPDGYAVTNAHVIQGETKIRCTVWFAQKDGTQKRVVIEDIEIIAVNSHVDLALIKMKFPDSERTGDEPGKFPYAFVQADDELKIGESVFAIGNPLGLERTLSQGVIATPSRDFEGIAYIQTTAAINPGNSGGPLFNSRGEVIGVTNMGILGGEGLGFAIPARYVRDFLVNREAFVYDKENPNSGHVYNEAPPRRTEGAPPQLDDETGGGG